MSKDEKYYTIWLEGKTFKHAEGGFDDILYRIEELKGGLVHVRWEEKSNYWTSTARYNLIDVINSIKDGRWLLMV